MVESNTAPSGSAAVFKISGSRLRIDCQLLESVLGFMSKEAEKVEFGIRWKLGIFDGARTRSEKISRPVSTNDVWQLLRRGERN